MRNDNERMTGAQLNAFLTGQDGSKWEKSESSLQAVVVSTLRAEGFAVLETGKGSVFGAMISAVQRAMRKAQVAEPLIGAVLKIIRSFGNGNDSAVPDLLVSGGRLPAGILVGLELKKKSGVVGKDQKSLAMNGGSFICYSLEDCKAALLHVENLWHR